MVRSALLAAIAVIVLAGCEEMVEPDDEPQAPARCDATPDWYLDLPIVTLRVGGQMNPPQVPDPNDPDDTDSDWSALEAVIDRYEGKTFTPARFKQLQRDLFATGLMQEGDQKWGIEFYVIPDLPRRGSSDPRAGVRAGGCLGVRMDGEAQTYYPQEIQERPLRAVR